MRKLSGESFPTLSAKVRQLRERLGVSQAELAMAIKAAPATVYRAEKRNESESRSPRRRTVLALASIAEKHQLSDLESFFKEYVDGLEPGARRGGAVNEQASLSAEWRSLIPPTANVAAFCEWYLQAFGASASVKLPDLTILNGNAEFCRLARTTEVRGRTMKDLWRESDGRYAAISMANDTYVKTCRKPTAFCEEVPDSDAPTRLTIRFPILDSDGQLIFLAALGCPFDIPPVPLGSDGRVVIVHKVERHEFSMADVDGQNSDFSELFLTTFPGVAIIKSPDSRILWANPAAAELYGDGMISIIGKFPGELMEDDSVAKEIVKDDLEVVRTGRMTGAWWRFTVDGKDYERFTIRFPIYAEGKVMVGALGVYAQEIRPYLDLDSSTRARGIRIELAGAAEVSVPRRTPNSDRC